ncbi:CLUMA_CG011608, isoform A [Clunio marinus]|uniref:CLUMA_CG011608, isoform A n=1 Tax=Clunio marinus TaxID=568069 RepID=A0A1J1IGS9_9DIPT|nr:CLUMA_CG011608, isoform A [Clunio marinus]
MLNKKKTRQESLFRRVTNKRSSNLPQHGMVERKIRVVKKGRVKALRKPTVSKAFLSDLEGVDVLIVAYEIHIFIFNIIL